MISSNSWLIIHYFKHLIYYGYVIHIKLLCNWSLLFFIFSIKDLKSKSKYFKSYWIIYVSFISKHENVSHQDWHQNTNVKFKLRYTFRIYFSNIIFSSSYISRMLIIIIVIIINSKFIKVQVRFVILAFRQNLHFTYTVIGIYLYQQD